jgi:hypothetical protein
MEKEGSLSTINYPPSTKKALRYGARLIVARPYREGMARRDLSVLCGKINEGYSTNT